MDTEPAFASVAASLRKSHPQVPAIEVLDIALKGLAIGALAAGTPWLLPEAPFGQLVAEAFDTVMSADEWVAMTTRGDAVADPAIRSGVLAVWSQQVLPGFAARYGGWVVT